MVEEKKKQEKEITKAARAECNDKFCPIHGKEKLKLRGRVFKGEVIKKLPGRVTVQFERTLYVRKYERFEKRKTKLHARLSDCIKDEINVGDKIEIAETRPISKMIHFVVVKKVKGGKE